MFIVSSAYGWSVGRNEVTLSFTVMSFHAYFHVVMQRVAHVTRIAFIAINFLLRTGEQKNCVCYGRHRHEVILMSVAEPCVHIMNYEAIVR